MITLTGILVIFVVIFVIFVVIFERKKEENGLNKNILLIT